MFKNNTHTTLFNSNTKADLINLYKKKIKLNYNT